MPCPNPHQNPRFAFPTAALLLFLLGVSPLAFSTDLIVGTVPPSVAYVTGHDVVLEGTFSGIVVQTDNAFVNGKKAIVDCGAAVNSVGLDLGAHSNVHVLGGKIQNCNVGVLIGTLTSASPEGPNPPPSGSNNTITGLTVKRLAIDAWSYGVDPVYTGGFTNAFPGIGMVINNGNDNALVNNQISGTCYAIHIYHGSGNSLIANTMSKYNDPTCGYAGVLRGILLNTTYRSGVYGNTITDGLGLGIQAGIDTRFPDPLGYATIVGNTVTGHPVADLQEESAYPDCGNDTWLGNTFVTTGGAGAACIQ